MIENERTLVLEKKVANLEKDLEKVKEDLMELKTKTKTTEKVNLSFPAFRQFCQQYSDAGAYCSNVNYGKWKSSGDKLIFSHEDHLKTVHPTYYSHQNDSWPCGSTNNAYDSNKRKR